jgi:chemotaxis regulatin CheY-phosphate phosphatase CheZ
LNELSRTLLRAYAETIGVVTRIRQSCGMLDNEGLDRLEQMRGRLREISTATETATTDILDTVTRAIAIAERIDGAAEGERGKLVVSLKEELGGVSTHLQFQDITAQQLGHLANLIADMRHRITHVVTMFAQPGATPDVKGGVYDPNASTSGSAAGQAVADEIFSVRASRKTA